MTSERFVVLVVACALGCERPRAAPALAALRWVGVAHQHGCVGYRDPPAVISPDGERVAYGEGRFLRVRRLSGGPVEPLPPLPAQVRDIAWHPDGDRLVVESTHKPRRLWVIDRKAATFAPLFGDRDVVEGDDRSGQARFTARHDEFGAPAWSTDGRVLALVADRPGGSEVWRFRDANERAEVTRVAGRVASLAFAASGDLACVDVQPGSHGARRRRLELRCGGAPLSTSPEVDWYGPIAFSPDATTLYAASPRPEGAADQRTLDLYAIDVATGGARPLTSFDRDTYAPSVSHDGSVLFRLVRYRTEIALAPADGGASRPLTTFQSETPFWDPTGARLAITYGTWRRQVQDVDYPDIDQRVGVVDVGPSAVDRPRDVVPHAGSEDQAASWSPNGRWFSYHSHRDGSDDLWIRGASDAGFGRRLTFFSRGAETAWPRWSADGRLVAFATTSRKTGRHAPHVVGVDPETGATTAEAYEIEGLAIDGDVVDLAFLPAGDRLVALVQERPGSQAVVVFPALGGPARVLRRIATEHANPGFALAPDGANVAFAGPAPDGFTQIFRAPIDADAPDGPDAAARAARQITADPTDKTQPAWSPDGKTIAFTVWSYDAALWLLPAPPRP